MCWSYFKFLWFPKNFLENFNCSGIPDVRSSGRSNKKFAWFELRTVFYWTVSERGPRPKSSESPKNKRAVNRVHATQNYDQILMCFWEYFWLLKVWYCPTDRLSSSLLCLSFSYPSHWLGDFWLSREFMTQGPESKQNFFFRRSWTQE
jgi:hypothetical protein